MNSNGIIYISDGITRSVKITVTAAASGFSVDTETRLNGSTPRVTHIDVFRARPLAVAAAKTEAARVAQALMTGVMP